MWDSNGHWTGQYSSLEALSLKDLGVWSLGYRDIWGYKGMHRDMKGCIKVLFQ